MDKKKKDSGIWFMGLHKQRKSYPIWRYHKILEPKIVNNTEEDAIASENGWKAKNMPIMFTPTLHSFNYDLEEFSVRQLVAYAKSEFDIDLPEEAGKERLLKWLWRLYKGAPENRDRVVLLSQSMKMNYDEAQNEIKKAVENASDVTKEVIWL